MNRYSDILPVTTDRSSLRCKSDAVSNPLLQLSFTTTITNNNDENTLQR